VDVDSIGTRMDTRNELEKFMAILFDPTDLVELRTFNRDKSLASGGDVWRRFVPAREVINLVPQLCGLNTEREHNIYIGINPRMREGGTREDVALARCLCADWDEYAPEQFDELMKARELPPPTLAVHSGHGLHAYWRLSEPLTDLDRWEAAQAALIARAKSDNKIKDAPRVMRLPGFVNLRDPDKDESDAQCVVIRVNAEARYGLAEVVGELAVAPPRNGQVHTAAPGNDLDRAARLSRQTLQFVFAGAATGERNHRLFSAACDMAGNSIPFEEARERLLRPALASGLEEDEADGTIRSAYAKPRAPAVPEGGGADDDIASAFQRAAESNGKAPTPELILPAPAQPADGRATIGNIVDAKSSAEDGGDVRYYMPLPQIALSVSQAMGGWPRLAGGILFSINPSPEPIPDMRRVRWLTKPEKLFAWIGTKCNIRWSSGETRDASRKDTKLNPPTKQELYAYFQDGPITRYRAVEILPHHPAIRELYYLPCELPALPVPSGDEATPLQELVGRFNPESDLDRKLMLAALLTPGWGGPPGARPAFVFCSDHGRGTGKTTTANVMAEVWGGAMTIGAREDWDQVRKRFLGDDALTKRIALIDNIKGRLSGGDLEGFITAKELDGWKPYVGQASRPNLLTWYLTANSPSLSRDLADRAVVIKVGRPAHANDFIQWATDFVREHRALILAELFEILRGENFCTIEAANRDRWSAWQCAVLTKFEDGNEMAELATNRRGDVDSDQEDAEEIATSLARLVSEHVVGADRKRVLVTYQQLHSRLVRDGVCDKSFGYRASVSWIKDRLGSGPLAAVHPYKDSSKRGVLTVGDLWKPIGRNDAPEEIPDPPVTEMRH
jgi:hypothetical protein